MRARHIESITIEKLYETGTPEWFVSNGLRFHWYSWLLCEVMGVSNNPRHSIIATDFHVSNFKELGTAKGVTITRWNPSYEDDYHRENVKLESFHFWKPISIVLLKDKSFDDD